MNPDAIRAILREVSGKMLSAHAAIPRTKEGIKAKTLLVEANELIVDLHTALKGNSK